MHLPMCTTPVNPLWIAIGLRLHRGSRLRCCANRQLSKCYFLGNIFNRHFPGTDPSVGGSREARSTTTSSPVGASTEDDMDFDPRHRAFFRSVVEGRAPNPYAGDLLQKMIRWVILTTGRPNLLKRRKTSRMPTC